VSTATVCFARSIHNLRLIVGRSTRLPDPNHVTARGRGPADGFRLRASYSKPSSNR
jgi:hypothetical protein